MSKMQQDLEQDFQDEQDLQDEASVVQDRPILSRWRSGDRQLQRGLSLACVYLSVGITNRTDANASFSTGRRGLTSPGFGRASKARLPGSCCVCPITTKRGGPHENL